MREKDSGEGKHSSESLGEELDTEQIITQTNMKLIVILKMLAQSAECSENVLQEKLQGCLSSEGKKPSLKKTHRGRKDEWSLGR